MSESHALRAGVQDYGAQRRCRHHLDTCAVAKTEKARLETFRPIDVPRASYRAEIVNIEPRAPVEVRRPERDVIDAHVKRLTPQFSGRALPYAPWHFIHHGPLQLLVRRLAPPQADAA
jgi:hypothetical protein